MYTDTQGWTHAGGQILFHKKHNNGRIKCARACKHEAASTPMQRWSLDYLKLKWTDFAHWQDTSSLCTEQHDVLKESLSLLHLQSRSRPRRQRVCFNLCGTSNAVQRRLHNDKHHGDGANSNEETIRRNAQYSSHKSDVYVKNLGKWEDNNHQRR